MLKHATAEPNTPTGPIQIRFRNTTGAWITLTLTGVGIRPSIEHVRHVLCRTATP